MEEFLTCAARVAMPKDVYKGSHNAYNLQLHTNTSSSLSCALEYTYDFLTYYPLFCVVQLHVNT